ncbi:DNA 5'-adenosine monophosphate hydrolase NDAI_0E01030 [Naumovozyma dairenensis CBS 421]|uniref:Aprataxin C2HE/C2H2/C2HC zinc finger domain-containing protein n=1 Tax=Naumovozyma dairenensis (strain ATCC 10597 / BCRC 20456 / CBS 421 / NBRC 0211 / NRRL Y-12639) TaxID=1071378 RepID=G0WAZ9_NAUDC|nr:hypothetical protein NDAI_0E01030 [Naumovozyma dairenensis CBS 421]CCD24919.1 hypothetical protein NDAI_0E01030 [Naumovozyma dairenensis CBS 421]
MSSFWKSALQIYVKNPQKVPSEELVYYDEKVTIINDKFPKSTCHLLILPRDGKLTLQHPTIALTDRIKDSLEEYVRMAQEYIFKTFTSKYKLVKPIPNVFDKIEDFNDMEIFIDKFITVGVHSVPSMANLHIHVITKDFHSEKLKYKNHYLSFNSEFYRKWDSLPLEQIPVRDEMIDLVKHGDLICCYCNANFKNQFAKLKKHLNEEFENHFKLK